MKLTDFDVFDCFLSGGRDSALSCYIAFRVANALGKKFRLIHIDTGVYIKETRMYVEDYARWLGTELKVIKTKYDYFEKVKEYGYPNVFRSRWCWRLLKQEPLFEFRVEELREKVNSLWVIGIRKNESLFRLDNYGGLRNTLTVGKIKNLRVYQWLPVLHLNGKQIDSLIKKFGIPRNSVWDKIGISGECLCLAGTSKKTLEAIFINYPEIARKFHDFDISVTPKSKGGFRPKALADTDKRLYEFIEELEKKPRQTLITEYFSCQGSCMILR